MKNGFTLIELLAVIVILVIILLIAVPQVLEVIEDARISAYQTDESMIIKATKSYLTANGTFSPNNIGDTIEITLSSLIDDNYISDISDNSGSCDGYILVTKKEDGYSYNPELKCGDSNAIGSSSEDGLILYYSFDDFQEPTENIIVTNPLYPYGGYHDFEYDEENNVITMNMYDAAQYIVFRNGNNYQYKTLSYSGYMFKNNTPTFLLSSVANTYHHTTTVSLWKTNPITGHFEITEYFDTDSIWLFHSHVDTMFGDTITIKDLQIEEKPYITPYVDGIRTGTIQDYSINNYDSTLSLQTTPRWMEEKGNGYYYFNGVDSSVSLPNNIIPVSSIRNLGVSYSAWIRPLSNSEQRIFGQQISDGYSDYSSGGLGIDENGRAQMIAYSDANPSSYLYAKSEESLSLSEWSYLVGTFDPTDNKLRIYVNGELSSNTPIIGVFSRLYSNNANEIGRKDHYTSTKYYYNGDIDELKIYNRALSEEEIKYQYDTKKNEYE